MLSSITQPTYPDSSVVLRDAATLVLLRDNPGARDPAARVEVLLLRRAAGHVFGPGADVFPGGALDDTDAAAEVVAACGAAGLNDARWRVAALRECFEEAGLLPGLDAAARAAAAAWRQALIDGRARFVEVLGALGVCPGAAALLGFACWTTPPGPPRRYATRFFAARAPAAQQARTDGRETVAAQWISPAHAVAEADAGRRYLMGPSRVTLARLAAASSAADALTLLADGGAPCAAGARL